MSLIVFNKFAKPADVSSANIDNSNVPVGASLTEFVSRQLSNWASQINRNFNVDLNYTPGDALTQEQYDVAVSTKVLNDRLSIYTSFGFGSQEQNRNANYGGG